MSITFTGINNIRLKRNTFRRNGLFEGNDGIIKEGEKNFTCSTINAKLTNDEKGNDLSDFKKAINSADPIYQANCINLENPDRFKFEVKSSIAKDVNGIYSKSMFVLNDQYIFINSRQNLKLFEFLAKFTKKLEQQQADECEKSILREIGDSITQSVTKFLE